MRPSAYIFSMLQCIVFPFINPANHDPGVQIGHCMGVICSIRLVIKENLKKIFTETCMRLTTQVSSIGSMSLLLLLVSRKSKEESVSPHRAAENLRYRWSVFDLAKVGMGSNIHIKMSCDMRFATMWYVPPAKPQISLHIRAV